MNSLLLTVFMLLIRDTINGVIKFYAQVFVFNFVAIDNSYIFSIVVLCS